MFKRIVVAGVIIIACVLLFSSYSQAATWTKVSQNDVSDLGIYDLTEFNGYLYTSTGNWGVSPAKILRSSNGTSWTQVNANGFGDTNNVSVTDLLVSGNYLYAITTNQVTGTELWRCSKASLCNAAGDWAQVNSNGFGDVNNISSFHLEPFSGYIFTATYNSVTGTEVWRCSTLSGCDAQGDFSQVNTDGFLDVNNSRVWRLHEFNNYLYVFTTNSSTGVEAWRCSKASDCDDQSDWAQVNTNGYGSANNIMSGNTMTYNGVMYVGTYNSVTGGELWKTTNGTSWVKVTSPGFIKAATVWINPSGIVNNCFYLSARNNSGGEVWKSCDGGSTWSLNNTAGFGVATNVEILAYTHYGSYIYYGTWNNAIGGSVWRSPITPLAISSTTLPTAKTSVSYSKQITRTSGTTPYTFSKTSGTLPTGLSLSSSGLLHGKPTKAGKYTFTIKVTDSGLPAQTATKAYTLTVFKASININHNHSTTTSRTVKLYLSASDGTSGDIKYMRFSNNGSKWTTWKKYKKTYSNWNITSSKYGGKTKAGTKRVYVKFKTKGGIISPTINDKIRYKK